MLCTKNIGLPVPTKYKRNTANLLFVDSSDFSIPFEAMRSFVKLLDVSYNRKSQHTVEACRLVKPTNKTLPRSHGDRTFTRGLFILVCYINVIYVSCHIELFFMWQSTCIHMYTIYLILTEFNIIYIYMYQQIIYSHIQYHVYRIIYTVLTYWFFYSHTYISYIDIRYHACMHACIHIHMYTSFVACLSVDILWAGKNQSQIASWGNLFFGNTHSLPQRVQNVDCQAGGFGVCLRHCAISSLYCNVLDICMYICVCMCMYVYVNRIFWTFGGAPWILISVPGDPHWLCPRDLFRLLCFQWTECLGRNLGPSTHALDL